MRPKSHREQIPDKCCGTCIFAHFVAYKRNLLCFHGDTIKVLDKVNYPVEAHHIELDGQDVSFMEGDEYDKVWGGRIIEPTDICDEYKC